MRNGFKNRLFRRSCCDKAVDAVGHRVRLHRGDVPTPTISGSGLNIVERIRLKESCFVLSGLDLQGAERKIRDEERKQSKRKGKCTDPSSQLNACK